MILVALLLAAQDTGLDLRVEPSGAEIDLLGEYALTVTVTNNGAEAREVPPLELEARALHFTFAISEANGGTAAVSFEYTRVVPDPVTGARTPPQSVSLAPGRSLSTIIRIPAALWGRARITAHLGAGEAQIDSAEAEVVVRPPAGATGVEAVLVTNRGEIPIALDGTGRPNSVTHFAGLARSGFYDGLSIHALVPDKWMQAGCPFELGVGGPGYAVPREPPAPSQTDFRLGVVGLAHYVDSDHTGSQFFICFSRIATFDLQFTTLGAVTEAGLELLRTLRSTEVDPETFRPTESITITGVTLRVATGQP